LELARLWQSDDQQARPLSQFLAAALRWLTKHAPESDCVFTYADPAQVNPRTGQAHNGTIYRATNFTYVGKSRVTDRWRMPKGEIVSAAKAYRRFKTKSRAAIAARTDWTLVEGVPKHLFVFGLRLPTAEVMARIGRNKARRRLLTDGGGFRGTPCPTSALQTPRRRVLPVPGRPAVSQTAPAGTGRRLQGMASGWEPAQNQGAGTTGVRGCPRRLWNAGKTRARTLVNPRVRGRHGNEAQNSFACAGEPPRTGKTRPINSLAHVMRW
jgi:hypothetical protein